MTYRTLSQFNREIQRSLRAAPCGCRAATVVRRLAAIMLVCPSAAGSLLQMQPADLPERGLMTNTASRPPLDLAAQDALEHHAIGEAIYAHIGRLPLGSVIAVQGSWGRGKTDVVARIFHTAVDAAAEGHAPYPLWLNPWQYGQPDLISPLVVELVTRLTPQTRSRSIAARRAAVTLLRAASAMIIKAVGVVTPLGGVLDAATAPVDDLIKELFGEASGQEAQDRDPVAAMAQRFGELVDEYLAQCSGAAQPLVICVDDLDRCLPDHQIAMLEAIHFLTSTRARAAFLVALDPTLVQQAAITHYRTAGFDSDQYLDKLFDLRVTLRSLDNDDLLRLIDGDIARDVFIQGQRKSILETIERTFGLVHNDILSTLTQICRLPELRNPRVIRRIVDRIYLFSCSEEAVVLASTRADTPLVQAIVAWCSLIERWPAVRSQLQAVAARYSWPELLKNLFEYYKFKREGKDASGILTPDFVSRIPTVERHPDLSAFLHFLLNFSRYEMEEGRDPARYDERLVDLLSDVDKAMTAAGL
jgi:hypothetical protein